MPTRRSSISVVIPTHNRARLVRAAIDSVLAQTLAPCEIIVIDDGSTDGTRESLADYGERIRYVWKPNGGVSSARNAGIALARGEFLAFLDSDDFWLPTKLETQVAVLERLPDVTFLFTEFRIEKEGRPAQQGGSRRWLAPGMDFGDVYEHSASCMELGLSLPGAAPETRVHYGNVYDKMLHEHIGLMSTGILRRGSLDSDIRFSEGVSLYEDWEFCARVARAHTFAFLDLETAVNRSHNDAYRLTRKSRMAKIQCYLDVIERVWKADLDFMSLHDTEVDELTGNALLALARECLLSGQKALARSSLARWRRLATRPHPGRARLLRGFSALPGGGMLLRAFLLARALLRLPIRRDTHYSSRPG